MTDPTYQSILSIICTQLGVPNLDKVDSDIAKQAHAIALTCSVQTHLLSASALWTEASRDDREALGGSVNLRLAPSGRFEQYADVGNE